MMIWLWITARVLVLGTVRLLGPSVPVRCEARSPRRLPIRTPRRRTFEY